MAMEPIVTVSVTGGSLIGSKTFEGAVRDTRGGELESAKTYELYQGELGQHRILVGLTLEGRFELEVFGLPWSVYQAVGNPLAIVTIVYNGATTTGKGERDTIRTITGEFESPVLDVTPRTQNASRFRQVIRKSVTKKYASGAAGNVLELFDAPNQVFAAGDFGSEDAAKAENRVARVDYQVQGGSG